MGPGLLQQPVRFALALGLVVAGGLLLYELVVVVEVFALALIMALVLAPAVDFLVGLGLPRFLALLAVLCALAVGIGLLGYIVAPLLFEQVGDFAKRAPAVARGVQGYLRGLGEDYPGLFGGPEGGVASLDLTSAAREIVQRAGELYRFTTRGAGLLLQAVGAVVMAVYMVSNPRPLVEGVLALFPRDKRGRVAGILALIRARVSGWILGQLAAMAIIFLFTWAGLALVGVEFAFTFAVLTGVLQIVPFFGPLVSAVPPTLVALADGSPTRALLVVAIYVVVHQIEAHIVSPLIMARSVQLHPVTVIIAVLVMGNLLGLAGVILAVPAAAVVTVLLEELYVKPLGAARVSAEPAADEGGLEHEEKTPASRS